MLMTSWKTPGNDIYYDININNQGPISMTRPCSISSATNKIERIIREPALSRYGSDDGLLEHREALLEKVRQGCRGGREQTDCSCLCSCDRPTY